MVKEKYIEKVNMLKDYLDGELEIEALSDKDKEVLLKLIQVRTRQVNKKIAEDENNIKKLNKIITIINELKSMKK